MRRLQQPLPSQQQPSHLSSHNNDYSERQRGGELGGCSISHAQSAGLSSLRPSPSYARQFNHALILLMYSLIACGREAVCLLRCWQRCLPQRRVNSSLLFHSLRLSSSPCLASFTALFQLPLFLLSSPHI